MDVFEELTMVSRAVGAEVFEDGCERSGWHGDLEKVVHEWDLDIS